MEYPLNFGSGMEAPNPAIPTYAEVDALAPTPTGHHNHGRRTQVAPYFLGGYDVGCEFGFGEIARFSFAADLLRMGRMRR